MGKDKAHKKLIDTLIKKNSHQTPMNFLEKQIKFMSSFIK